MPEKLRIILLFVAKFKMFDEELERPLKDAAKT